MHLSHNEITLTGFARFGGRVVESAHIEQLWLDGNSFDMLRKNAATSWTKCSGSWI